MRRVKSLQRLAERRGRFTIETFIRSSSARNLLNSRRNLVLLSLTWRKDIVTVNHNNHNDSINFTCDLQNVLYDLLLDSNMQIEVHEKLEVNKCISTNGSAVLPYHSVLSTTISPLGLICHEDYPSQVQWPAPIMQETVINYKTRININLYLKLTGLKPN